MKLYSARARLDLIHTFRIARSADEYRESVLLRLEEGEMEGLGEAAPMSRYGQTAESAERAIAALDERLLDPTGDIEKVLSRVGEQLGKEKAALAAIDIALHDLLGKRLGTQLYSLIGLDPDKTPVTSYTIGIDSPEVIEEKVREAADFPVLKIKMGLENDHEIMETVRRLTDRTVRVDANEGWTKEEALEKILWLEGLNVELIEQPLPADNLDDIRWLAERVSLPLFADESVHTTADIPALKGAFNGINIKLMKSGGIREALKMIHKARSLSMLVMLGCTVESSIGITAAAQISPLVDYADLDGNVLISNDPATGVKLDRGRLVLPRGPGIGATLNRGPMAEALGGPDH